MNEKVLIRHFWAMIHYRGMKYLSVEDEIFNSYIPQDSIRNLAQILNHINGLLLYIQSYYVEISDTYPEQLQFKDEVGRFQVIIRDLDQTISSNDFKSEMTYHQLLQGPLAEIMLHIGELSMLRKVSGAVVDDVENYIFADIKPGDFK